MNEHDNEREEWAAFSLRCLARAYGDDEPEYTLADIQWPNAPLPPHLVNEAYFSAHEWALPQAVALQYLRWCQEQNIEILGYDVWAATTPRPTDLGPCGGEGNASQCLEWIERFDVEGESCKHGGALIVFNIWARS